MLQWTSTMGMICPGVHLVFFFQGIFSKWHLAFHSKILLKFSQEFLFCWNSIGNSFWDLSRNSFLNSSRSSSIYFCTDWFKPFCWDSFRNSFDLSINVLRSTFKFTLHFFLRFLQEILYRISLWILPGIPVDISPGINQRIPFGTFWETTYLDSYLRQSFSASYSDSSRNYYRDESAWVKYDCDVVTLEAFWGSWDYRTIGKNRN